MKWSNAADATLHKNYINQQRLCCFLSGSNPEYDQTQAQILGITPLPALSSAIATIKHEESRRNIMMNTKLIDSTALAARSTSSDVKETNGSKGGRWCDHCKRSNHNVDTCWKLYPHLQKEKAGADVELVLDVPTQPLPLLLRALLIATTTVSSYYSLVTHFALFHHIPKYR
ncbi:unnamed protein product [Cuscuta epithymum]|uniref:Uncharacterized protein n=1 Tax=Cuscuta epithymum TaxID=186058 RepID=A0AAV0EKF6_9ASTE|nr:unnamed protein product [Cuscuta epithymum]